MISSFLKEFLNKLLVSALITTKFFLTATELPTKLILTTTKFLLSNTKFFLCNAELAHENT